MITTLEMWSGEHKDGRIPVFVRCEYDEDTDEYIIIVKKQHKKVVDRFPAKVYPEDGLMHISDAEMAVKIANKLCKEINRVKKEI